eukprot:gnl/TRDRNA2_/TRDRNA2_170834_c1_seq1.p1 gnl/TRDRNA2_/TRDRNA2_170834_c1~~gnl/TRDRNA2_/TRDRNA2_170834_c1_seq1.p1  ORF type:complete len:552 (+),score=86.02 gnl/TRDRNA2_/TRDRNA2_170834_c1_seq1:164-1819(+)
MSRFKLVLASCSAVCLVHFCPLSHMKRQLPAELDEDASSKKRFLRAEDSVQAKHAYQRVTVIRTRKGTDERLTHHTTHILGLDESGSAGSPSVFVVPGSDSQIGGHPWLGFGGSFTESASLTLNKMSRDRQHEALSAYFDSELGIGYNLGRMHIGSCDFSTGNWTCGDLMGEDMELRNFSIQRYGSTIIPMYQRASKYAEAPITLLASPWSPPPWMKTKVQFNRDGHLRKECGAVWALHFVRFVQEMSAAEVPIWAVSVQNEPEASQRWESCIYTAEEERDFVREHLGPALEKAQLSSVKIVVWDHNRDAMVERAAVAYADPEAAKYIWGVGYHWYGDAHFELWPARDEVPFQDRKKLRQEVEGAEIMELRAQAGFNNVRRVAELRPEKHIIFTEGCQELGGRPLAGMLGDWKLGERYAMNIINDMNSGCEGWIDWNLYLDETGGPNHVGNLCVAPIILDTIKDEVLLQPIFYYLGHFSRYIRPGARRIVCSSSRDALETTAFLNLDGSIAVVVMNQSESNYGIWLKVAGCGAVSVDAPGRSISTFIIDEE